MIDLFAGCGGFSYGCQLLGAKVVVGIDSNAPALRAFTELHPGARGLQMRLGPGGASVDEVLKLLPARGPYHVHMSPPCQTFSAANTLIRDEDPSLMEWCFELAQRLPRRRRISFSIENVNMPSTRAIAEAARQRVPRRVAWTVLDASDFGVPSSRMRLWAASPHAIERLEAWTPVSYTPRQALPHWRKHDMIMTGTTNKNLRGKPGFKQITPADGFQRSLDEPSYCVTSKPLRQLRGNQVLRNLTVDETAALVGFPRGLVWPDVGIKTARAQLGNVVPPPQAAVVYKCCRASPGAGRR